MSRPTNQSNWWARRSQPQYNSEAWCYPAGEPMGLEDTDANS